MIRRDDAEIGGRRGSHTSRWVTATAGTNAHERQKRTVWILRRGAAGKIGRLNGLVYETGRPAKVDISEVTTREDAVRVVADMVQDLRDHPDAWENSTLDRFLEALASSMEGIESGYRNRGKALPAQPTWAVVAELLVMATGYE
jgi:hypothetical protein